MKKRSRFPAAVRQAVAWYGLSLLLFSLLPGMGLLAASDDAGNLIPDPGFETATPLSWKGVHAKVQRSVREAHSGQGSLLIQDESNTSTGIARSVPVAVSLQGGGRFYAEAWLKIDAAATSRTGYGMAAVDILFYSSDGEILVSQPVGRITSSRDWFRVSNLVTLPYEAARIGFQVTPAAQMPEFLGNVFVDDLYLAPLPVAEANRRVNLPAEPEPPRQAADFQAVTRPEDGRNLALSIEKLTHGFSPERPFVIWALGSSFTDFLGNGEELIAALRKRFPSAPPIVYKKMVGGSTPYNMLRGWARHLAIPDQPDLVLIYNFGLSENLEKLFAELRCKTTADIMVGSLHWCRRHESAWPDPEIPIPKHVDAASLRQACRKFAVEFVEIRRDVTTYMLTNNLTIPDLLVDAVHQSPYLAKMINESFAAHFNPKAIFSYDPRSRERRIEAEAADAPIRQSGWKTSKDGEALVAVPVPGQSSEMTLEFTGNRVDLVAQRSHDGGKLSVWLDGKPAGEVNAFHVGYIQPGLDNFIDVKAKVTDLRRVISDRCPHGIELGPGIIPQEWIITMTSDEGDYQLTGSITGFDGKGNAFKPFTSSSGQIQIPPDLWRLANTNRSGDRFTFSVRRSTLEQVDLKGKPGLFRVCIADQLPNTFHRLTLKLEGTGEAILDAFEVFEPPLKPEKE